MLCGGQVLRATVNKSLRDMDKKLTNVSNVIYNLILLLIIEDQSPGGADSAAGLVASLAGAVDTHPATTALRCPITINAQSGDVGMVWQAPWRRFCSSLCRRSANCKPSQCRSKTSMRYAHALFA